MAKKKADEAAEAAESAAEEQDAVVQPEADDQPAEDATEAQDGDVDAGTESQDEVLDVPANGDALAEVLDVEDEPYELPEPYDPRQRDRELWLAANPGATVIPPSLLPAAFQDGNVVTAGWPASFPLPVSAEESDVEESDVEDES